VRPARHSVLRLLDTGGVRRAPFRLALVVAVLSSSGCASRMDVADSAAESSALIPQRRSERPRGPVRAAQPRQPLSAQQSPAQQGETTLPGVVATTGSDDRSGQRVEETSGSGDRVASAVPYSDRGATGDTNSTEPRGQSWWESHVAAPRAWPLLGVLAIGLAGLVGLLAFRRIRH